MRFASAVIFLIGLLSSNLVFAHEAAKHHASSHHHQHTSPHHTHPHHSQQKLQKQRQEPQHNTPVVHQSLTHQANHETTHAEPLAHPVVTAKPAAAHEIINHETPHEQHLVMTHGEKHRWRHCWGATHYWAATHHFHNPHLIRRSIVFATETEHGIVALIHKAIASLHQTHYRYGGNYFNMSNGIYELDCSDYVDDLLKISQPRAYEDLADSTHTEKPTSNDYYQFFNNLSDDNSGHYWQRVDDVESLKPGDILVFSNYGGGGHVMVVMDTPTPALSDDSAYFVKVSDSASSRHSDDTRPSHASGIGIGTLLLKENPETGEPSAYAWTVDSGWDRVRIAMAEPVSQV
jgi:hypothetical protein